MELISIKVPASMFKFIFSKPTIGCINKNQIIFCLHNII